jgi:hypothetical protein
VGGKVLLYVVRGVECGGVHVPRCESLRRVHVIGAQRFMAYQYSGQARDALQEQKRGGASPGRQRGDQEWDQGANTNGFWALPADWRTSVNIRISTAKSTVTV